MKTLFLALQVQVDPPPSLFEGVSLPRVFGAVLLLILAWLLIRWLSRFLEFLSRRVARARFFFKRVEPAARILGWFVAVFLAIDLVAPSRETFWAGVASIGLALGLGAQDLVKNVIGGLIVLADRPYQLGDRVRIGDAYGEIDHIGLRSTKLTTPDDTRVTIPNADVLTQSIYNANSGVPDCQVVTDLYLPPDVDPDEVLALGREVAYSSPFLLARKPVTVLLSDGFNQAPYVRLRIKAYVHDHRYEPAMQSDVTTRAKRELLSRGLLRGWSAPTAEDVETAG